MIRRHRLPFTLLLAGALAGSGLGHTQALYRPHDGVVSADPADGTPHVLDGKVLAILPMGERVYVGGTFTQITMSSSSSPAPEEVFESPGLFALDPATNQIDETFRPNFLGVDPAAQRGVHALAPAPDGQSLFAGGDFSGGKVVRLDARTGGLVSGFGVAIHSAVKSLAIHGDRLFAAGIFDTPRQGLVVLDAATGIPLPEVDLAFTEPREGSKPRVEALALTPDGTTLVAGGNFTRVDGQERWQVALLDVTPGRTATLLDWHTDRFNDTVVSERPDDVPACAEAFDAHIKDLDMSPDGRYFVVATTGGYTSRGPLCDTISRWVVSARGEDLHPTWAQYVGGDTITGVAATGSAVYASGHFRWVNNYFNDGSASDAEPGEGSVEREGIVALDPASGLPFPWNPRRERGHGAEALVSSERGLWVGSDTDFIGGRDFDGSPQAGEIHRKLAFFPLAGGIPPVSPSEVAFPLDLHRIADDGLSVRSFDGSRLGPVRTLTGGGSEMRGAFAVGDRVYTATDDGTLVRHHFDGSALVAPQAVDLRGLDSEGEAGFTSSDLRSITGMFFTDGRLYYTRDGDEELFYRSFLSQPDVADDVVGDREFVAGGDHDWSEVAGMTLTGGHIYWSEGGDLSRIPFERQRDGERRPTGAPALVQAGAGLDARGWFLMAASAPPPAPPPAPSPSDPPAPQDVPPPPPSRSGYWMVTSEGKVYVFGDAGHRGDAVVVPGGGEAVDLEPTPSDEGYWIVDAAGRVQTFGDARHLGQPEAAHLAGGEQVTSLSGTPSGAGYWLFTTLGRALAYGDARHHGDMSGVKLNGPVLDSIPTPTGNGYYMVASDGGIFSFGDARFYGSMGGIPLNAPVQSLVPDLDGAGYWLVAGDGGVFSFEAPFRGSMGDQRLNKPVSGMVPYGTGYLMVAEDGGIFNFSDLPFSGSLGNNPPARPVVSVAAMG